MTQLNRNSKSSLMKIWVMYLNGIVPFLQKTLGSGIKQIKIVYGFEIEVDMTVKLFYPFILFLKKHSLFLFNILTDIICYDCPGKSYRFSLVYNLLSVKFNSRLRVIVKQKETKSKIVSLMALFRSANWSEREVFDFYGLFFFSFWSLASLSLGFVSWVHVCVCVYAHVCVCIPTHVYTVCTYRVMCACRCTCIGSHTHMQARIQCMHVCTCALRTAAWLAPDLLCNRTGGLLLWLPLTTDIRNR